MTENRNRTARIFPAGLLVLAAWFLFNPNFSIIDPLPDFVAYALILRSLRTISSFVPYMREACNGFRRLFSLGLFRLASLSLFPLFATQRVTLLLLSLVFSVLELIFLLPAVKNLFEGLFYLGQRFGVESALSAPRGLASVGTVPLLTYIFVIAKALLSTLPDFCFLFEYDPLTGEGFTVTTTQYLIILSVGAALALALGIVWLFFILPYFRGIGAAPEPPALTGEGTLLIKRKKERRSLVQLPFLLFTVAAFLSVDLRIDKGSLDILPEYLSAIPLLLLAVFFLWRYHAGMFPVVLGGLYLAVAVAVSVFSHRFYSSFAESDLSRLPGAAAAYLPFLISSIVAELLYLALFSLLFLALTRFFMCNIPEQELHNDYERRLRAEELKSERKQSFLCLFIAFLSSCAEITKLFLPYKTVAAPTSPDYSGGTVYIPSGGAFWLVSFFLSLLLAIVVRSVSSRRKEQILLRNGLDDGEISAL